MKNKSLIVLSSPSGGGKTTLAKHLFGLYPQIKFSISATTRSMRPGEVNGKDYFFLTKNDFKQRIQNNELVEYEEIFGNYYGTLKSEVAKAIDSGEVLIFDVDVLGALSIKKHFPEESLLIFIAPPSIEILEARLRNRQTESEEQIRTRLARAEMELSKKELFDHIIINEDLESSKLKIEEVAHKYFVI